MGYHIRTYQDNDFETVVDLVFSLQEYFHQIDTTGEIKSFISRDEAIAYTKQALADVEKMQGSIYVAEVDNQVVGFIQGVVVDHQDDVMHNLSHQAAQEGWIGLFFIKPEHRKQGIGKALIAALKEYFIDQKCNLIKLKVAGDNHTAIDIYSAIGFNTINLEMTLKIL